MRNQMWKKLVLILVVWSTLGHSGSMTVMARQIPSHVPITAENARTLTEFEVMFDPEYDVFVEQLAFGPQGKWLASEQTLAVIRLWDVETGELEIVLQNPVTDVSGYLLVNPVYDIVAFSNYQDTVIWDLEQGRMTTVPFPMPLAFSPDGTGLLVKDEPGMALWDLTGAEPEQTLSLTVVGWPITFTPDGEQIIFPALIHGKNMWYSDDQTIQIRDIESDVMQTEFPMIDNTDLRWQIDTLSLSSSGRFLAYSVKENLRSPISIVVMRDLTTGVSWMAEFETHRIAGPVFNHDESVLIFGTYDGLIHLVSVATGEELAVLTSGDEAVSALAISPDGTLLASGGKTGMIRLWGVSE